MSSDLEVLREQRDAIEKEAFIGALASAYYFLSKQQDEHNNV